MSRETFPGDVIAESETKSQGISTDAPSGSPLDLATVLRDPAVYRERFDSPVVVHETHISWVFLAGDYAYKVKKPIKTDFLDYSTLEKRERLCHEELRLDSRFAKGLYRKVLPITLSDGKVRVDGRGQAIEFAVQMHRFSEDALLSHRLQENRVSQEDVVQLAKTVAAFHASAEPGDPNLRWGSLETVVEDAMDNLTNLAGLSDVDGANLPGLSPVLGKLRQWTTDFARNRSTLISQRVANGFVRACHGDMHLANVVQWQGQLTPFDGIEFNDRFRWIDVLSDAAFLSMDFAARERPDLGRSFINAYLEITGDHASLPLLRWYLVYRALVRGKVAAIKLAEIGGAQPAISKVDRDKTISDCLSHIELADRFTADGERCIWITHGLSGSGKTRGSEAIVQRWGAIRFRSDIERKRHYGFDATHRPNARQRKHLYSEQASQATYGRLRRLARTAIDDGFAVIIDATFLKFAERESFRQLADSMGARFAILDFRADHDTLRKRVADRLAKGTDASDADVHVLERQIESLEPLTPEESREVVSPESGK